VTLAIQRALLLSCLFSVFGLAAADAQDLYEVETRPVRGFMPNMDQLSSPIDHIDPVSRKLHLEIPLASLPRGRGGSGFDLNRVYETHSYDLVPEMPEPMAPYTNPPYQPVPGYWLFTPTGG
jgi:hypothetical protein